MILHPRIAREMEWNEKDEAILSSECADIGKLHELADRIEYHVGRIYNDIKEAARTAIEIQKSIKTGAEKFVLVEAEKEIKFKGFGSQDTIELMDLAKELLNLCKKIHKKEAISLQLSKSILNNISVAVGRGAATSRKKGLWPAWQSYNQFRNERYINTRFSK